MARCNCPQYHIPSANPLDSKGCPVHDPDYVDPTKRLRAVEEENKVLRERLRDLSDACEPVIGGTLKRLELFPNRDMLLAIGELHAVDGRARKLLYPGY